MRHVLFTFPDGFPLVGGTVIYSFGVFQGLALVFGFILWLHYMTKDIKIWWAVVLAIVGLLFARMGGRILSVIADSKDPGITGVMDFLWGATASYGVYIGGLLGYWLVTWIKKWNFWRLADNLMPSFGLGLFLGRIGCFLGGCCWGRPTDSVCGVVYPAGSSVANAFPGGDGGSLPLHPVQLYESMVGLGLLTLALILMKHRKFNGRVFLAVVGCYLIARFMLEFFRADAERGFVIDSVLSTAQFLSLLFLPLVIFLYFWLHKRSQAAAKASSEITE